MISLLLILDPLAAAACAWLLKRSRSGLRMLLVSTGALHSLLTALLFLYPAPEFMNPGLRQWIGLDSTSRIFLAVTSLLFLFVSVHTLFWLPAEQRAGEENSGSGHGLQKEYIYVSCLLAFLGTMTLVIAARNLGLLWVAVEATTLVSAPLILFHRSAGALEAMWKYLLICSVGIGLALFGTLLLAESGKSGHLSLNLDLLTASSASLHTGWFKAAFICILAGYGTKMGLAPFHTWLPDAHSEAPGTVSALLSGSLLNCSFLAIIRFWQIAPEELAGFCRELVTALGVVSLALAAFFIIRQTDFKRMLAYSSVEHMGLLAVLWANVSPDCTLLHLCGHSLIKMTLFLIAGNLLLGCGTRQIPLLGGLIRRMPRNSVLWLVCCLLICGVPPSPLFVTELLLLLNVNIALAALIALLLFAVFAGMMLACLKMTWGPQGKLDLSSARTAAAEKLCVVPLTASVLAVGYGLYLLYLLIVRSM